MKHPATTLLLCIVCLLTSQTSFAQDSVAHQDWMEALYEPGIRIEGDTIFVSDETRRIASDSAFRSEIYPDVYRWSTAQSYFDQKEYKLAFWFLLNIYADRPQEREKVLKYILNFDQIFIMDKLMTSSFFTYAFLDPQVALIHNGVPEVQHPEIIEDKQASLRQIVQYIREFRAQQDEQ